MLKARYLQVPLTLIILSFFAFGCAQRIPARSQSGQAADGWTPSSIFEAPIGKDPLKAGAVTASTGGDDPQIKFGVIQAGLREPIRLGETIFVVYGFREVPSDVVTKAKRGHKFIAVEVSITNVGEKNRYYAGVRDLWLRDDTGLKITNDGQRAVENINFLDDGATEPNEMIRGEVNFEVPEDQNDFDLYFEPITLELQQFGMVRLEADEMWKAAGSQIPPHLVFDMPGPKPE